jgi:signal peptidase I
MIKHRTSPNPEAPASAASSVTPSPLSPSAAERHTARRDKQEGWRSAVSTVLILLLAPLIAIVLITFVFQSYQVDGQSMETTLSNRDRLIIWKLPRTWARITHHDYVPKRGDVIVFSEPELAEFGQDPDKQLIKRVIALPGERIAIKDGVVTVYNDEFPDGFQPDNTLPYGSAIGFTGTDTNLTVPVGHIFVMGDNRGNSLDSRAFGPVDLKHVVGKLVLRVLPLNKMQRF